MGEGILAAIGNLFSMVANVFGYARQRDAEKNAANVQAAATAQKEQSAQDKTKQAIQAGDIEEERQELSE